MGNTSNNADNPIKMIPRGFNWSHACVCFTHAQHYLSHNFGFVVCCISIIDCIIAQEQALIATGTINFIV